MRGSLVPPALAALMLGGGIATALAQPDAPDPAVTLAEEERRICALAADPNVTVAALADAQADADAILLDATALLIDAELHRLYMGAGLLVAAANAFVETTSGAVEMARIALGGTTYTLATVMALKSVELGDMRAALAESTVTREQLDAASGLAVELYVALSLHAAILASAAGIGSGPESSFPSLDEIFLFKADVSALLAAAPNISNLILDLGSAVVAAIAPANRTRLDELADLEAVELPARRTMLAEVEAFHGRAYNCTAPTLGLPRDRF